VAIDELIERRGWPRGTIADNVEPFDTGAPDSLALVEILAVLDRIVLLSESADVEALR
jgi:hypothetical protein